MTGNKRKKSLVSCNFENRVRAENSGHTWGSARILQKKSDRAQETLVVHLVSDSESDKLARAQAIFSLGYHAKIYSSIKELIEYMPNTGIILLSEGNRGQALECVIFLEEIKIRLPVLAYYDKISAEIIISGIKGGVYDFISTSMPIELLSGKLQSAFKESVKQQEASYEQNLMSDLIDLLTKREKLILSLLAEGWTNNEISQKFEISVRTIDLYRHKILKKLAAKTMIHAILIYFRSKSVGNF